MSAFTADFAGAAVLPSPNFGDRLGADGATRRVCPDMLLLHYTGMPDHDAALSWLCNPQSQVSSHYFVHEDGRVLQLVAENCRAWHAGKSGWAGETDINSASIGIEIANAGHDGGLPDFPPAQMEAVAALCSDCIARHGIAPQRVLAHSDVAPGRKQDPGEKFPWDQLYARGIGHWAAPAPLGGGRFFQQGESGSPVEALQTMLKLYGYDIEPNGNFCERTGVVVAAFQRHFRPQLVDGIADVSTIDTLHRLLRTLPRFAPAQAVS